MTAAAASIYSLPSDAPSAAAWTLHATADLSPRQSRRRSRRRSRFSRPARSRGHSPAVLGGSRRRRDVRALLGDGPRLRPFISRTSRPVAWTRRSARRDRPPRAGPRPQRIRRASRTARCRAASRHRRRRGRARRRTPLLPFELGRFAAYRPAGSSAWVHVRFEAPTAAGVVADVALMDASGVVVAEVGRLRLRRADLAAFQRGAARIARRVFSHRVAHGRRAGGVESRSASAGRWSTLAIVRPPRPS